MATLGDNETKSQLFETVGAPSPTGGGHGEWSTVDKKPRRLVPQHSLSKQDLGTDSNKAGAAVIDKKKGGKTFYIYIIQIFSA